MKMMPLPSRPVPGDLLRKHRAIPELDGLLVQPNIVDVAQADGRGANEATSLGDHRCLQARHNVSFKDQIIVQVEDVRSHRPLEEELTLLGHAATRTVPSDISRDALGFQYPEYSPYFRALVDRKLLCLIGNADTKIVEGLRCQRSKRNGQRRRSIERRDKNVNFGRHKAVWH